MTTELTKAAQQALEVLKSASNGLTWYRQEHPEDDSPADEEMHEAINQTMRDLRNALTQRPKAQTEREAFEHTMSKRYGWVPKDFKRDDFGYFDGHTNTAWAAWQARASLPAPQQVTPSDAELPGMWSTSDLIGGETDTQKATQSREASEAEQRARMQARLATRPEGKATADFDLPAPNDAIKKATPEPLTEHADHIPEIAARLRLVAKLAGCPQAVPENDHTAVGAIFSVLGNMRYALELKQATPEPEVPEMSSIALRKLGGLQDRGWQINGYAIRRGNERGLIDSSGFVGWWRSEGATVAPDDIARYQAIRNGLVYIEPHESGEIYVAGESGVYTKSGAEFDSAIDAIAASQQKGGQHG